MEGLFDNFEFYDTENGKVFEFDGNQFFEWNSDDENGSFHFNFNGDELDVEEFLEKMKLGKEDLMKKLEGMEYRLPEIDGDDSHIIIKRLGEEDVVIELQDMEEWSEQFSKDAEKWAESLGESAEEWARTWEERSETWRERSDEMKEQKEFWKEKSEEMKERQKGLKEGYKEHEEDRQDAMREREREVLRQYERAERADENGQRDQASIFSLGSKRGTLQSRIEKELRRDGLMSGNGTYTFKLKENRLKVNGKKQSDAMYQKYKDIYERYTGSDLEGSSFATSNTGI
jgi:uncharacterized phage infection (PIP) family protein YhgE